MAFTLTPTEAPAVSAAANEYDDAVKQVEALIAAGTPWAKITVANEKDAENFKRNFGQAANRAGHSRKFGPDQVNADGTVLLTVTLAALVKRQPRVKSDGAAALPAPETAADVPSNVA